MLKAVEYEFGDKIDDIEWQCSTKSVHVLLETLRKALPEPQADAEAKALGRFISKKDRQKRVALLALFFGHIVFTSTSALASLSNLITAVVDGIANAPPSFEILYEIVVRQATENTRQPVDFLNPASLVLCLHPLRRARYRVQLRPRALSALARELQGTYTMPSLDRQQACVRARNENDLCHLTQSLLSTSPDDNSRPGWSSGAGG